MTLKHPTQQQRIKNNLCTGYGDARPLPNLRQCMECAKVASVRRAHRYRRFKDEGRCKRCCKVKPIVAGGRCEECRVINNATSAAWRDRRRRKAEK